MVSSVKTSLEEPQAMPAERPNLLLITADDMNWDAVGAFGCPTPGTTPNLDRLASQGRRFELAHVAIAVCQPSRSAIMTGRYPHNSGGEGFHRLRHGGVPIMPALLRGAGYRVGILGKLTHSTPYADFEWDMTYDRPDLGEGRNPRIYARYAGEFFRNAAESDEPFFLMANSEDPHRPFYGNDPEEWYDADETDPPAARPSRVFRPEDVVVPGFLPDLPEVRREIAEYYSSVHRCDDTVGRILEELEDAGLADDTLVLFLSDNGMAFPFAKTNCYLNSTRTPWIVRWPGRVEPDQVDNEHFVSGIDIMPTFLEAAGVDQPEGVDGVSFLPVLERGRQRGREMVFTEFHQTAARRNYPMRCVQTARFGYIWNPWSNGERVFRNESQAGRTFDAMEDASEEIPEIAARVDLFLYRVPEELYDFANDPDARNNLVDEPEYAHELERLRTALENWMEEYDDPALEAFRHRDDRAKQDELLDAMVDELGGTARDDA
jgi:N-sulfoglucosamine sulfohydrolase